MNSYIIGIIIILLVIFLIYIFYEKINDFIQKYIISSQNVEKIKQEMKDLENTKMKTQEKKENTKIIEKINEILYLPFDFIYKLIITYGTPIFYNLSKNI